MSNLFHDQDLLTLLSAVIHTGNLNSKLHLRMSMMENMLRQILTPKQLKQFASSLDDLKREEEECTALTSEQFILLNNAVNHLNLLSALKERGE